MLKVDVHTHIMPDKAPNWVERFGYGDFIRLDHHKSCCARMIKGDKFFREIESNCWDPVARMKDCQEHNVHVQVLSPIPVLFNYWAQPKHAYDTSRFYNDHIAKVVEQHPKNFIGLGTLPMQDPELACIEMERCMTELNLAGVEIGSHINDWNLSDEALFPFFEKAAELNASLFVHPWDMMGFKKIEKYWLPWLVSMPAETSLAICSMIFGGVFERLPNLKVCFAHGGGSFPATIGRIEHGFNVRPDLCAIDNNVNPKEYLGKFYCDSLLHDQDMLNYLVNLIGADRIALGTDYPFPLGELQPGKLIEESKFDQATKEMMLSGSALDWLGLKKEQFI